MLKYCVILESTASDTARRNRLTTRTEGEMADLAGNPLIYETFNI
jgi:hypothetical protein